MWVTDKGLYKCSYCNNLWLHWWAIVMPIERMNKEMPYCPKCGKYMVNEDTEQERKNNGL